MPRPKPTIDMHLLGVRIEKAMFRRLTKLAKVTHTPISYIVRNVLNDYLNKGSVK